MLRQDLQAVQLGIMYSIQVQRNVHVYAIYVFLQAIQLGDKEDKHGWMREVLC